MRGLLGGLSGGLLGDLLGGLLRSLFGCLLGGLLGGLIRGPMRGPIRGPIGGPVEGPIGGGLLGRVLGGLLEMFRSSPPHLVLKMLEKFFYHMVGDVISVLSQVCFLKCSEFHEESQYVCKTSRIFLTTNLPHPAPTPLRQFGCWARTSHRVIFFQEPPICVFKMISATRGSV